MPGRPTQEDHREPAEAQLVEKEKQLQALREELDKQGYPYLQTLDETINNLNTNDQQPYQGKSAED